MAMRIEKGYLLYGGDMTPDYTPYEVGMGWALSKKKAYTGRAAALAAKGNSKRKLVMLAFDDPHALCYGWEPVLIGDDVVGRVTSAEYGYAVGKYLALALVDRKQAAVGTVVEVMYTGKRYRATVSEMTLFDPKNERIKA